MEKISYTPEDVKGGEEGVNTRRYKSEWEYGVSDSPELVLKSPEGQEKARLTSEDINTTVRLGFRIDAKGVSFKILKRQTPSVNTAMWKQRFIQEFGLKFEGFI